MNRTIGSGLVVVAVVFAALPVSAQPRPPAITSVLINGGATTTTSDQVTMRFTYTHEAAAGVPIPFYRLRAKSPDSDFPAWGQFVENPRGVSQFTVVLVQRGRDPIPGLHTIELQLKDNLGQESVVATGSITRIPAPVPRVEYRLTGSTVREAIAYGESLSYGQFSTPANFNSRCAHTLDAAGGPQVSVAGYPPPAQLFTGNPQPECLFRFLQHKPLQEGWVLKRVSAAIDAPFPGGCPSANCSPTVGPLSSLGFSIRLRTPRVSEEVLGENPNGLTAGTGVFYSLIHTATITELVFEGPGNRVWRDAFRP